MVVVVVAVFNVREIIIEVDLEALLVNESLDLSSLFRATVQKNEVLRSSLSNKDLE